MAYLRDSDLLEMISNSVDDECVFAGKSGKHYARRALIARCGPPPFEGAICRHLCKNDSQCENTCIKHTVWGTLSENMKDCGHKIGWAFSLTEESHRKSAQTKTGKTMKNKGRPLSEEHKRKLSEARKRYLQSDTTTSTGV